MAVEGLVGTDVSPCQVQLAADRGKGRGAHAGEGCAGGACRHDGRPLVVWPAIGLLW